MGQDGVETSSLHSSPPPLGIPGSIPSSSGLGEQSKILSQEGRSSGGPATTTLLGEVWPLGTCLRALLLLSQLPHRLLVNS